MAKRLDARLLPPYIIPYALRADVRIAVDVIIDVTSLIPMLGFAGMRSVFRCPFQRAAFAFFALAAFAAEPFPA